MLFETLQKDRLQAMKLKDKKTSSLLGVVIADLQRKQKTDDDTVIKTVVALIGSNREFLNNVEAGSFKAQELVHEITVLEKYLPAQLSGAELRSVVENLCKELGVTNMSGMGKVMGKLKTLYRDKLIDGSEVKQFVQEFVS